MNALKIALVYDLRGDYLAEGFTPEQVAEFDTESTISALEETLRELGNGVERVGHGRALCKKLAQGDRWDLVFTIAEGVHGRSREAQVPCLLEMFGLAYTFSDPLTCALTLDKAMTKRVVAAAGLPTPRYAMVTSTAEVRKVELAFPLFAKPVAEGTGKGIDETSRVDTAQQLGEVCGRLLERYRQPVIVEEYLPGREFTAGVLGTGPAARVLGVMEVRVKPGAPAADYSYKVKEMCEQFVEYGPMEKGPLRSEVESLALAAHRALECRDTSRVDVRLDAAGRPSFLEINPLPGLHPSHSDLPMIAAQEGMSYRDLIGAILASAAIRHGLL